MTVSHVLRLYLLAGLMNLSAAYGQDSFPEITGSPLVYSPKLLDWALDAAPSTPDLTEPTSNRIYDLHMQVNDCSQWDVILSTSGNYHMALTDFWYSHVIPTYGIENWYFSTSPPISPEQATSGSLSFGNVTLNCMPHVAVGPKDIMDQLQAANLIEQEPIPLFTNRGNVLLVRKGNPKNIRSFWDLQRPDVRVATSNPYSEPGSFGNYATSLYQMALHEKGQAAADELFTTVFGTRTEKWVVGERIHHREVPYLLFADQADVAPLFYHLARYVQASFPDVFDLVPLGGTLEEPEPLPGNKVAKLYLVRIRTELTEEQAQHREHLIEAMTSSAFDPYLEKHFMDPAE